MEKLHGITLKFIYQKLMVLYSALLIVGTVFHYEPPYYILLLVSILTVFFSKRNIDASFFKQYVFIAGLTLYGIIVAVVTKGGYGGPITIVTGLMVCYAAQQMEFDEKDITLLVITMCISMLYWLYRSPAYYSEFFYNHWRGDGSYTNANGVGHYLAYECSYMFMLLSLSRRKWRKRLRWILAAVCIWGCLNVKARMATFTLAAFLLVDLLGDKFSRYRERIVKTFLIGSVALEILFPFVYLWMYRSGIGSNLKMFGLSEKGLYSGREDIWQLAFDSMESIPQILFGIGSKHDFWRGNVLNMHSNAMNLLVVVGLFGLVSYFSYLIYYIFRKFDFKDASRLQWQCLIFFICIVLEGTTDITLFYNPFLAFYFIPLGIALNKNYQKLPGGER